MGEVCQIFGRIGFRGYTKEDLVYSDGAITLSPSNIVNGKMSYENCTYITWTKYEESPEIKISNNDIILVKTGSSYGKCALVTQLPHEATINPQFVVLKYILYNTRLLSYVLQSGYARYNYDQFVLGTAIPTFTQAVLANMKIPLPPQKEQIKIVETIERWFSVIDNIKEDANALELLIKKTKSKILDLAISGKLVPQDPNDEPAIELLKRINPNFVPCDNSHYENLPFEIPDSWELCKFGDFLDVRDGTHNSPRYLEKGYPLVTSKNLKNGDIDFDTAKFISTEDYINFSQRSFVEDGDILFAMIGSIGNPVLVKKCREFSIKNVALFKPYDKIHTNMKYVFYYLLYVQEKLKYEAKGGMQPFIPLNYFRKELYIPIPPYNEQERIVEKVSKIFEKIDSITAEL